MSIIKRISGQALVEMVVVLGLAAILITGIVTIVTVSIRNSGYSQEEAQASRYSQEAIEWIRQQRDTSWSTVYSEADGSKRCMQNLTFSQRRLCGTDEKINGIFTREATLSQQDGAVAIDVVVSWAGGNVEHQSRLSTILTNWKGQ